MACRVQNTEHTDGSIWEESHFDPNTDTQETKAGRIPTKPPRVVYVSPMSTVV